MFDCTGLISTQKLTNMRIMKENMRTGNLPANMKKNRVLQIIPCKRNVNRLFCIISFSGQYIYHVLILLYVHFR